MKDLHTPEYDEIDGYYAEQEANFAGCLYLVLTMGLITLLIIVLT